MQAWFSSTGHWLYFVGKTVVFPLAILAVFEGVRRFSPQRTAWKAAVFLVCGMAFLCGQAGVLLRAAASIEPALDLSDQCPPLPAAIPDSLLAQLTLQERHYRTHLLARMEFGCTGTLRRYIDASGLSVVYAPSEEQIRNREFIKVTVAETRMRVEFARAYVRTLVAAAITAVLAGLYARRGSR
jgi:hypothetical protein